MNIDSFYRPVFSFFIFFGFLISAGASMAQSESVPVSASSPTPPPAITAETRQSLPPEEEEMTILRDDYAGTYNPSSLVNLSKAYWRLGAFDLEDDVAITNFLKINDCKVYVDYVNDDMEFQQIKNALKEHLKVSKDKFPLNFQFSLELHLGRYDPALGGFPIVDKTGFKDSKRILVSSIENKKPVCYEDLPIAEYPKNLIVLTDGPFTLDFLKVDEHVAQAYILRKKSEFSSMAAYERVRQTERDAYLRLRITLTQYHGNLRGATSDNLAIVYANVDGYEVFEDVSQKRLMLSVDLKRQKEIAAAAQMSVPVETAEPAVEPIQ